MRKAAIILAAVLTLPVSVAGAQEKGATPQDVVHKVKQAASPGSRITAGSDSVVR
jgi:hypothetical protein